MQLKKLFFTIAIFCATNSVYSQTPHKERVKMLEFLSKHLDFGLFEDSTAFYTCNIQITLDHKNAYKPVLTVSNPKVSDMILGIYKLEKYDFKQLIGKNKYIKLIIPIGVTILGSRVDPPVRNVDAYQIREKALELFYHPIQEEENRKIEYLEPALWIIDKRVFD